MLFEVTSAYVVGVQGWVDSLVNTFSPTPPSNLPTHWELTGDLVHSVKEKKKVESLMTSRLHVKMAP